AGRTSSRSTTGASLPGRRPAVRTMCERFERLRGEPRPRVPRRAGSERETTMHPMTIRQIALVRRSWQRVLSIQDVAADLFDGRLIERHPEVGPMFHIDIVDQGRRLMQMIGIVVSQLDRLSDVVPTLEELGRRHAAYGVTDAHYEAGGEIFL